MESKVYLALIASTKMTDLKSCYCSSQLVSRNYDKVELRINYVKLCTILYTLCPIMLVARCQSIIIFFNNIVWASYTNVLGKFLSYDSMLGQKVFER